MMFKRIIKVDIDGLEKTLDYPELNIEFKGEFSNDNDPDDFIIYIRGLSQTTINKINKDKEINLQAGYQDDFGTIITGIIKDAQSYKKDSTTMTEITVNNDNSSWNDNIINQTFNPPITTKQILERIIPASSLETGFIELKDNKTYQRGKTVTGRLSSVIKQLGRESNTNITLSNGKVNLTTSQTSKKGYLVNAKSGLISTPQKINKKDSEAVATFDMLFNHNIKNKSLIKLESSTFNGNYEVVNAKFNKDFTITLEIKEVQNGRE